MSKTTFLTVVCSLGLLLTPALAAPKGGVGTGKKFKGPVGVQLYSFRDSFKESVAETLDKVEEFGFVYVELAGTYGMTPKAFRDALANHSLKPIAGHFSYEAWRDEPEAVVTEAKALGLEYAGCAWIPHQDPFDITQCKAAAKVFNRAGEAAAKEKIKFFYHNHGYEFQPYEGGTLFDQLMKLTDSRHVSYEMDLLWTVHPGQDPVALLNKYGKRWALMHLKDLRDGVAGDLSGGTDTKNDVALGTGQVDFPAVLKAAKKAGVKYYFIEDESPSVMTQIPQSLKFLEGVTW